MFQRVVTLTVKEFRQLGPDPVLIVLIVYLYTICVLMCACALSFDLNEAPIAVLDLDRTPSSREVDAMLERSPYFRVVSRLSTPDEIASLVDREVALAVVSIPSGWTRRLHRGEEASIDLVVDGSNAAIASAVRGYTLAMLQRYAMDAAGREAAAIDWRSQRMDGGIRVLYNPDLKFVYFVFISMVASSALLVGVIHPAASIVREKEKGTLEQLLVSPIRPFELIVAKLVPTFTVSLVGLTLSLLLSRWFEVPLRGSLLLLYLSSTVFLLSSMGIGILIGAISRNLQQALLLSFFGLIPIMFLSGTMVPIESMPRIVQIATLASPLRYYMECLLGLFLKGNGWDLIGPPMAAMALFGLGIFMLGLYYLRRRIG